MNITFLSYPDAKMRPKYTTLFVGMVSRRNEQNFCTGSQPGQRTKRRPDDSRRNGRKEPKNSIFFKLLEEISYFSCLKNDYFLFFMQKNDYFLQNFAYVQFLLYFDLLP